MVALACPSCGAEIDFRSSFSVYAVCSYCGSTVVRHDRDVQSIGKVADLPTEMTPLQVGTELTWHGTNYALAGRLRVAWADGAWNEWYMVAANGTGWLAEAQGFLSVTFPAMPEDAAAVTSQAPPALGATLEIGGRRFRVTDIKEAVCVGSEGELPFHATPGRRATYYDMLDPTGGFAGLEDSAEGRQLHVGDMADFDLLNLRNLRPLEGWNPPRQPRAPEDPLVAPATR